MPEEIDKLYSVVSKAGLYTKSVEEFKGKYSTPEEIDKLYSVVSNSGLYTKDVDQFKDKYFSSLKKKDPTGQPSGQNLEIPATGSPDSVSPQTERQSDIAEADDKIQEIVPNVNELEYQWGLGDKTDELEVPEPVAPVTAATQETGLDIDEAKRFVKEEATRVYQKKAKDISDSIGHIKQKAEDKDMTTPEYMESMEHKQALDFLVDSDNDDLAQLVNVNKSMRDWAKTFPTSPENSEHVTAKKELEKRIYNKINSRIEDLQSQLSKPLPVDQKAFIKEELREEKRKKAGFFVGDENQRKELVNKTFEEEKDDMKTILSSIKDEIPEDASQEDIFKMYYNAMYDRYKAIGEEVGIDKRSDMEQMIRQGAMAVLPMADVFLSSEEEEEYYALGQKLNSLSPIALLNMHPLATEEEGVGDVFMTSAKQGLFTETKDITQKQASAHIEEALGDLGISKEQVNQSYAEILDVAKKGTLIKATAEVGGGLMSIMPKMVVAGGITGAAFKTTGLAELEEYLRGSSSIIGRMGGFGLRVADEEFKFALTFKDSKVGAGAGFKAGAEGMTGLISKLTPGTSGKIVKYLSGVIGAGLGMTTAMEVSHVAPEMMEVLSSDKEFITAMEETGWMTDGEWNLEEKEQEILANLIANTAFGLFNKSKPELEKAKEDVRDLAIETEKVNPELAEELLEYSDQMEDIQKAENAMMEEFKAGEKHEEVSERMNQADLINEADMKMASEELYNAWEKVEVDESLSPEQKQNQQRKIESEIQKLEDYEFETETKVSEATKEITTESPKRVVRPKEKQHIKTNKERLVGRQVSTVDGKNGVKTVLEKNEDGSHSLVDYRSGEKKGETKLEGDITYKETSLDKNGNVESVTMTDASGKEFKIKEPEMALDFAIEARENEIGLVEDVVMERAIEKVVSEEEVLKEKPERTTAEQTGHVKGAEVSEALDALKQLEKDQPDAKGLQKIAEGISDLADAIGAKQNLTGAERKKIIPALQKIAKGISEETGLQGAKLIQAIKDYLREKGVTNITEADIDAVSSEILPAKPATPKPKSPEAERARNMFKDQRKDFADRKKKERKNIFKKLNVWVVDQSANIKTALSKAGAEEVVMKKDLVAGSSAKTKQHYQAAEKKIFDKLEIEEEEFLADFIQAKRTIELDNARDKAGEERVKSPKGVQKEELEPLLEEMKDESPELYAKVEKRAAEYFKETRKQLDKLHDAGLLTDEAYEKLSEAEHYSPRQFIQYLDPETVQNVNGKRVSVSDSGLELLKDGSEESLMNDPRTLLHQVISRTNARIAKNEASKSLYEWTEKNPNNGLTSIQKPKRYTKEGKPVYGKAPVGKEVISAMVDGNPVRMLMPSELASEWITKDPIIRNDIANIINLATGASTLRAGATGLNPAFALGNVPKDVAHVLLTTEVYSPHLPIAMMQISKDIAKVSKDASKRKGRYEDYIEEGGGMDFLATQGRVIKQGTSVKRGLNKGLEGLQHYLGYINETSEILVRLATRERAIENGIKEFEKKNKSKPVGEDLKKIQEKATWEARTTLDFSQGGSAAKAMDTFIPYLNASIQGTRTLIKGAKKNPQVFAYKTAQLGAMATGLYLYNMHNWDGWDQLNDHEKQTHFIFGLPTYSIDKDGNKNYDYIKIPKSHEQIAITGMFESMTEFHETGKMPTKKILDAVKKSIPDIPILETNPPIVEAFHTYDANWDNYRQEKVWKGKSVENWAEYTKYTPEFYKKIGKGFDLSPDRLKRATEKVTTNIQNNVFAVVLAKPYDIISSHLGDDKTEADKSIMEHTKDIMHPLTRRFFGSTRPGDGGEELERLTKEENTKKKVQNDFIKEQAEKFESKDLSIREFVESIKDETPEDKKRMTKYFKDKVENKGIPWFYTELKFIPSPESKAAIFYDKWSKAGDEDKEKMMIYAKKSGGIVSDRFKKRFNQLQKQANN